MFFPITNQCQRFACEIKKRATTATTIVYEPELKTERSKGKEGIYVNSGKVEGEEKT